MNRPALARQLGRERLGGGHHRITRLRGVEGFGETEVEDLDTSRSVDHHILRFQITVDDLARVRLIQPFRSLYRRVKEILHGNASGADEH